MRYSSLALLVLAVLVAGAFRVDRKPALFATRIFTSTFDMTSRPHSGSISTSSDSITNSRSSDSFTSNTGTSNGAASNTAGRRKRYDPTDETKKTKYSPTKVRLRTPRKSSSPTHVGPVVGKMLGYAHKGDIDAVMQLLSANVSSPLTLREYNMLLKELCDGGRLEPCGAILEDMRRHGIKPSVITYTTIISRAGAWQKVTMAEMFFNRMVDDGIAPDAQAYNSLISAYAKSGEVDKATRILAQMDREGVLPTVVTFNTLIESCARTGKVKRAKEMLLMMKTRGLTPDERSFSAVVHACCQAGQVDSAFQLVQKMDVDGIKPSAITYSSLLHGLGKTGDLERAFLVLNLMKVGGLRPNVVTMSSLMYACGKHGQLDVAIRIYREMLRSDDAEHRPNSITCSTLVDACLKAGEVAKAFAVVRDMRSRHIPLTEVTYTSLITELTRLKQLDRLLEGLAEHEPRDRFVSQSQSQSQSQSPTESRSLAQQAHQTMQDNESTSYNPDSLGGSSNSNSAVFPGSAKTISDAEPVQRLKSSSTNGIAIPLAGDGSKAQITDTYFDESASKESALETAGELMEMFRERCNHEAVVAVYEALKARGTTPNARIYKILLNSLYENSNRRAEAGDDVVATTNAVDAVTSPITSLRLDKQLKSDVSISHSLRGRDKDSHQYSTGRQSVPGWVAAAGTGATAAATVNTASATPPAGGVAAGTESKESKRLRHDELFRLYLVFQEMRIAGVQADAATYNTLINACASVGDLEKALETVETMQYEGIEPDVITYTSLLKACGINGGYGTVVIAEEIFAQMQQRTNHFSNYVEPTELTFQRLMQVHLRAHSVNTRRIWELLDDMLRRKLKPGVSCYRSCVKAAVLEGNVEKGLALLIVIRDQTRMGFDFKSWQAVAALCNVKGHFDDEFMLRRDIDERRSQMQMLRDTD